MAFAARGGGAPFRSNGFEAEISLKQEWAGFDLVKVGGKAPMVYRRACEGCPVCILSGCITTVSPMKNQAGWDLSVGWLDPRFLPQNDVPFLAPTAMSRYEGIYQCGTSACLKNSGAKLTINFTKNTNPMVLHFSGFCYLLPTPDLEPIPIPVAQYEMRDWMTQTAKRRVADEEPANYAFQADEESPPRLYRCGNIIFLQGQLEHAIYGPKSQIVGHLPDDLRPQREVRWLAVLLRADECVVEHTVAVTLRPDGTISVQGGKMMMIDQRGNTRLLPTKKQGRLCLDGIRYVLGRGLPVEPSSWVRTAGENSARAGRSKVGHLMSDGGQLSHSSICFRQDDVVVLEGFLSWASVKQPNAKQALASLPRGCWPQRRETFFTRGGSDVEERRRIDVDQYGRIFCPEGVSNGRVELTGIIFIAAESESNIRPPEPEWDDLKLQYHREESNIVSTSFDGHELLEAFASRCNLHEWDMIGFDFQRHAFRKMLMPLGYVYPRGHARDKMNLGNDWESRFWKQYTTQLSELYGIKTFYTLLHVSNDMFDNIAKGIKMSPVDYESFQKKRKQVRQIWESQRRPGLTFAQLQELATQIVDQMFEHWDFKSQLQGALQNDLRAPATIEHLFPQGRPWADREIRKKIKDGDWAKFEEVRQFFYFFETTGNNMTHCSLMGSQDVFTTTGKWYFPDAPNVQKSLFENIAWLFPRKLYLYISERQTQRFPFIEDLDIQADLHWREWSENETPHPPDELLMDKPRRNAQDQVEGDPGYLMRKRALAIHLIYPHLDSLECLVYSASGWNKGKGMLKSSFHLVWPQLIVDPDRAPVIRHATLGVFHKETAQPGTFLANLQNRLLQLHESNNWELVFDNTTIHAKNGLRLPYSDKASMVIESEQDKKRVKEGTLSKNKAFKKRVKEDRPSKAIGAIRFEFDKDPVTGNDVCTSAKWTADSDSFTIAEWIGKGTCRRDPNSMVELTPWQLGPDVLELLPTKPGEEFYYEGEDDGEGGHWVTHKPYPNIRRYNQSTRDFVRQFTEAVKEEQDALQEDENFDLMRRLIGTWIMVNEKQALWQSTASSQFNRKVPDGLWSGRQLTCPTEVIFLKEKGKVIVSGPKDAEEALVRALRSFTRRDDSAVMPIYDLTRMQTDKPPPANSSHH
mmetsp:Transcript_97764/g.187421  ORF Transcript_97764/g.187421 Transcript_97764/m.187421 type:complete len:1145 (-) Transcript_97764:47-3481(-)